MNQEQFIIQLALESWNSQVKRAKSIFDGYTDEQLLQEVSPGRNRGSYLLGHLVASNDGMFTLFGKERLHEELAEAFLKNPDKSGLDMPEVATLRTYWDEVHGALSAHFASLTPEEWLSRHTSVSEEDFQKEPHRNKLNVLLSRTLHLSYHMGQVSLIRK
jgi:uncharacterized damage-inducible protein DinB